MAVEDKLGAVFAFEEDVEHGHQIAHFLCCQFRYLLEDVFRGRDTGGFFGDFLFGIQDMLDPYPESGGEFVDESEDTGGFDAGINALEGNMLVLRGALGIDSEGNSHLFLGLSALFDQIFDLRDDLSIEQHGKKRKG